jgi:hypothetical protein
MGIGRDTDWVLPIASSLTLSGIDNHVYDGTSESGCRGLEGSLPADQEAAESAERH